MSISKKIVESLGGNIWAKSKKGYGTIFVFTILTEEKEDKIRCTVFQLRFPGKFCFPFSPSIFVYL